MAARADGIKSMAGMFGGQKVGKFIDLMMDETDGGFRSKMDDVLDLGAFKEQLFSRIRASVAPEEGEEPEKFELKDLVPDAMKEALSDFGDDALETVMGIFLDEDERGDRRQLDDSGDNRERSACSIKDDEGGKKYAFCGNAEHCLHNTLAEAKTDADVCNFGRESCGCGADRLSMTECSADWVGGKCSCLPARPRHDVDAPQR